MTASASTDGIVLSGHSHVDQAPPSAWALGFPAPRVMTRIMAWSTLVTLDAVLLSFGCAAIGTSFSFYRARKAARLDPVDALRYE